MITLREPACAKVNLTLDVLCRREDGYHDLESIMQTISLQDDVEIDLDTGRPWRLVCDKEEIPCDERNLAWKAARLFFDHFGMEPDGIELRITKRIPSQAGLGGGSADAAGVLCALNRWKGNPLTTAELCDLGSRIGSDIPFCIQKGTALAEGRGERLTALPDCPSMFLVLCKPDLAFSTPALYRRLDEITIHVRPDHKAMQAAIEAGNVQEIGTLLSNVFEQAVIPDYPEIQCIKDTLCTNGACGALMTGSGSVVFGIFDSAEKAASAAANLKTSYSQVFLAHTV